jgi:hypothetical protein
VLSIIFDFSWERPVQGVGYVWEPTPDRILLVRIAGAGFESYPPLESETGLFRTFAALEPTSEAILKFANRYGVLGFPAAEESQRSWQEEIARMKHLVSLWDALDTGHWEAVQAERLREIDRIRHGVNPGLPPLAQSRDVSPAAAELVRPALRELLGPIQDAVAAIAWEGSWHIRAKRPAVKVSPRHLRDAMYLQLAQAMLGDKKYRPCKACGRWFELSPGRSRTDRVTCSDSCRVRMYRERQRLARDFHGKGLTLKEISKELDSDVSTIRKWVSKRKG